MRYKKLYQEVLTERNQFKQQCTQGEELVDDEINHTLIRYSVGSK